MPDSGEVRQVEGSQRADTQVRVFGMPPREGAQPEEIVTGFLEATTGTEPRFDTAKKYLTVKARRTWEPDRLTTVLADGPNPQPLANADRVDDVFSYSLRGEEIARVDEHHAYHPAEGEYNEGVSLVKEKGQWRIDRLPQGVVLGQSDFTRLYQSINKYYFAHGSSPATQDWLVADPVYVRQQIDPVTETVRALLEGPTSWLAPVVSSSFPAGSTLKKGVRTLALDDNSALTVPLNGKASQAGPSQCKKMATQLMFTLRDLTASRIEQVELERSNGSQLCVLAADQADASAPNRSAGRPDYQYFVNAEHRLVRLPESSSTPDVVQGPFGEGEFKVGTVGVARDEQRAAAVTDDGRELYTASVVAAGELGEPLVRSAGGKPSERLTAPSWDGNGDLWVADRDPAGPRLLRLPGGTDAPEEVEVDGLGADARVESLRVAADGVRIALLVREGDRTSLRIGRVESRPSGPSGQQSQIVVTDLREVAPRMSEVTAMSWAGNSRLVVAGRESGGVQQLRYVQTDGSTSSSSTAGMLPGVNRVTAIAASEDERLPLVAHSDEDGIVRLPPGDNWKTVVKDGSAPVYPG
ncbi:hypothetical protein GUY61_20110 [Streptomyces sp. GC420]|nr:hypothetical protein [Streptomyces sp. GC420]